MEDSRSASATATDAGLCCGGLSWAKTAGAIECNAVERGGLRPVLGSIGFHAWALPLRCNRITMGNTTLKDESVLWNIFSEVSAAAEKEGLSRRAARQKVIFAMARAYGIPWHQIDQHDEPVLYSNVSKITRLIFPRDSRAEANLRREIARGGLAFNDALQIARGNANSRDDCRSGRAGVSVPSTPKLELSALFYTLIRTASEAGYSAESIAAAFNEAVDEHEADGE